MQLENVACLNGCKPDDETLFVGFDRLSGVGGRFPVVRCRACELIRTNPRPNAASIGAYYPDDYGPYRSSRVASRRPEPQRGALFGVARRVWRKFVKFHIEDLPPLPPGRLLEIGCASGAYLQRMRELGWQAQGIEFSPTAAQAARNAGFDVQACAVEAARPPSQPVNLVVGWMVIEHLHDPVAALRKLASWTSPGGWLAISTPNAGSLDFSLFKDAGYALHVPNHLYHFTPRTLTRLLAASGWEVRKVYHQRLLNNLVGSIGHWLRDRGSSPRIADALIRFPEETGHWNLVLLPLAWLASVSGQTGRMTVLAQRSPDVPGAAGR